MYSGNHWTQLSCQNKTTSLGSEYLTRFNHTRLIHFEPVHCWFLGGKKTTLLYCRLLVKSEARACHGQVCVFFLSHLSHAHSCTPGSPCFLSPPSSSLLPEVQVPGLSLSVLLFSLFQVFCLEEKGKKRSQTHRLVHSRLDQTRALG